MPRSSASLAGDLPIPDRARHIAPFLLASPGEVFRVAVLFSSCCAYIRVLPDTLVNSEAHSLHIYGHSKIERIREYENENGMFSWRSPDTRYYKYPCRRCLSVALLNIINKMRVYAVSVCIK